jgi:hypothetical protein
MRKLFWKLLFCTLALGSAGAHAEQLVSPSILKSTENGVFMSNGRYFVAGQDGIHEIKRSVDNSPNCQMDPASGFTVCLMVSPQSGADSCFYSGMTTDDTYLYAVCTVMETGSLLSQLAPPKRAALLRIKPGASAAAEVKLKPFATPVWYNGMAMLDKSTILMTPSAPLGTSPAVVKLKITDTATLDHSISQWLPGSPLYLLPNGITISDDHLYFVGGQNLFRIRIKSDGSAGIPVLLYQTTINQVLDDLTVKGDWVAVGEYAIVNGLGLNYITLIRKTGLAAPLRLWTGQAQVSSLAIDPGTFGTPGAFIGTSYFQGGIYRFFY